MKETPEEMAARAVEWLSSPEGEAAMRRLAEDHKKACERLRKARQVSWEDMNRPVTI